MKNDPIPAAIYERARRIANRAAWTIELQIQRLNRDESIDEQFAQRKTADFHFLIITLSKLRSAAALATKVPAIRGEMEVAIERFDKNIPYLKTLRNVEQHIDDYAVGRGKNKSISRLKLEVWEGGEKGWRWLDAGVDFETVRGEGAILVKAINNCGAKLRPEK